MKNKTNRRDFLKKSTLAAAGILGVGFPTIDVKGNIMGANDRVRMGFIGIGNRGTQLLHSFMKNPDVKVTAGSRPNSGSKHKFCIICTGRI